MPRNRAKYCIPPLLQVISDEANVGALGALKNEGKLRCPRGTQQGAHQMTSTQAGRGGELRVHFPDAMVWKEVGDDC